MDDSFRREIEDIIAQTDNIEQENIDIAERTEYAILLSLGLSILRNDLKDELNKYFDSEDKRKDFVRDLMEEEDDEALAVLELFQEVYRYLGLSEEYYGDEERRISGEPLRNITGIDITELGFPVVIPKYIEDNGEIGITVSLDDIDQLRISELKRISEMAGDDIGKKAFVKNLIDTRGGIANSDILFE